MAVGCHLFGKKRMSVLCWYVENILEGDRGAAGSLGRTWRLSKRAPALPLVFLGLYPGVGGPQKSLLSSVGIFRFSLHMLSSC